MSLLESLVARLQDLPESSLQEISEFVDFLSWRQRNPLFPDRSSGRNAEPLLAMAGTLSGEPLSHDAIEAELYGDLSL